MPEKQKMPADGGGVQKGMPDGVSGTPGLGREGQVHGRFAGGESAGGAYPNPHGGESAGAPGTPRHGGQTEVAYYGGDNPNATASGGTLSEEGRAEAPAPAREPRVVQAGQQRFDVIEESGVAAAEASAAVATDDP